MCNKCEKTKELIEEWVNKQGHDSCWYYPDIFREIAKLHELDVKPPNLPSRCDFERGCIKYQNEVYNKSNVERRNQIIGCVLITIQLLIFTSIWFFFT